MTRYLTLTGLGLAVALAASLPLVAQDSSSQSTVQSSQLADNAPPPPPPPQYSQPAEPPERGTGAYNHGEITAFGDLLRVTPSSGKEFNYVGLGGRVGFNAGAHVAIEASMNYDFEKNYTTTTTSGSTGTVTSTTVTSKVRPITGLFGPKLQFGTSGPFRAFIDAKAGFIDFSESNNAPSGTTFTNSVPGIGGPGTHLALFPGGGIEFFAGPLGLRAEAGDEIWLNNGAVNNLRVTFGPAFRF
jgi:hypothetical protein